MSKGVLFVMSGPSGTGKGTICDELIAMKKIFVSVSATTREKRKGEIDGVTYHYTDVAGFEKMIADGEMLEYAKYGDNYYGTPKYAVQNILDEGKNVLLEIEPQGALKVKAQMPDAVLMFVVPPSMAELKKRLTERGREAEDEIRRRMETARWEITKAPLYNRVFVNDELSRCIDEVCGYIDSVTEERQLLGRLADEPF